MSGIHDFYEPAETVLLTGAGFTKTFGGYLGSEMWAEILNHLDLDDNPEIRKLMLRKLDYEAIYDEMQDPNKKYTPKQKASFTDAFRRAYNDMDDNLSHLEPPISAIPYGACKLFISRFAGSMGSKARGFFFTLNQDLFVERFYTNSGSPERSIRSPGADHLKWFRGEHGQKLQASDIIKLPDDKGIETLKKEFGKKGSGQFMYVKLHGSHRWQSQDGSDVLVIGHGKKGRLEKEPITRWYLSLFEEIIKTYTRNLVIIGYGFGDDHINTIIADAVKDNKLRLFIVTPKQPEEFFVQFGSSYKPIHRKDDLLKGLTGYHVGKVTDFYDPKSANLLNNRGDRFFRKLGI